MLLRIPSSEWANFRGNVPNGFSGRGGQTSCAYFPLCDPSGSSSGSGVSTSIGLTTAALGSETDGSIVSPSSRNNLVGIKPTVGLTSRAGGTLEVSKYCRIILTHKTVIPISVNQDTVGPMARSVTDAAQILNIIAGPDPLDNFTLAQPTPLPNFTLALDPNALKGVRLGVPRLFTGNDQNIIAAFNASIRIIKALGAEVVDPAEFPDAQEMLDSNNETIVLDADFKVCPGLGHIGAWYVKCGRESE